MQEVVRGEPKNRFKKLRYIAYTQEEARERGFEVVHWRDATTPGQYAVVDDGWVSQVLRVRQSERDPKDRRIDLPFGRRWVTQKDPWHFADWKLQLVQQGRRGEVKRTRMINLVRMYVAMMQCGRIDWDELGEVFDPKQRVPKARVKMMFKRAEVQSLIREELRKVYADNGVDEDFVVKTWKDAVEIAKKRNSAMALKGLIDTAIDLLDMKPEKQQKSLTGGFAYADGDGNKLAGMFTKLLEDGTKKDEPRQEEPDAQVL